MSVKVSALVWDRFPYGGHTLTAMLALADWANDGGVCYPSMRTIAARLRVSRSQAQRTMHALIEIRLVEVIGNHAGGAPGTSRRYRINLEALNLLPPASSRGYDSVVGDGDAAGSVDTQDGPHEGEERGCPDAPQTVKDPSKNPIEAPDDTLYSPRSKDNTLCGRGHSGKKLPRNDAPPITEIVDLYNKELGNVLPMAITVNACRQRAISARWREMLNSTTLSGEARYVDRGSGLEWWARFFRKVRSNPRWMGENNLGWPADLDWLTAPRNFTKVLEYRSAQKGDGR